MTHAPALDPVFAEPWHAQLFALTLHLSEAGHFGWAEWTERFGGTLASHGLHRDLDGGDDYFTAWLETLETLLEARGVAGRETVAAVKAAWEAAYLSTPHGTPVTLPT